MTGKTNTEDVSVRQRGRTDRSGAGARLAMYGGATAEPYQEPTKHVTRNPCKDSYRTASDFYAGPTEPGKLRNPRRNDKAYQDNVGYLMTDEGLMATAARKRGAPAAVGGQAAQSRQARHAPESAYGVHNAQHPKLAAADRSHVDNSCAPTEPAAKWRSGVRITHPNHGMDAPYFEDQDPRPPREQAAVTGRRHTGPAARKENIFLDPSRPMTGHDIDAHRNLKTNKANESKNVLCLKDYTAEELNEPRPTYRPRGAREWDAPEMGPAARPCIAPINGPAKAEHDVLGTGRWGEREKDRPQGVARGRCRPGRDNANIFAGSQDHQNRRRSWVPPDTIRKPTATQKKYGGQPDLLRYYDPSIDTAPEACRQPHLGNRSNIQSKNEEPKPFHAPRARGTYCKNSQQTTAENTF